MHGWDSWTIKKADCQRVDTFEMLCWKGFLRVPWTARRSNQSTLKEISTQYSLEELILRLKLQYFGHLMQRTDSLEKTLMLGEIADGRRRDDRERDGWMALLTRWIWIWACSGSWWWKGSWHASVYRGRKESNMTEWLNWTEEFFSLLWPHSLRLSCSQ